MERNDLDIPEETTIELGPGEQPSGSGEQPAFTLDPDRDDTERNAGGGGWDGANEQIENDFETEQLRMREDARELDRAGGDRADDDADRDAEGGIDTPLT